MNANNHWLGYEQIADILIKNGANINTTDNNGDSALHTAVAYGDHFVKSYLLKT